MSRGKRVLRWLSGAVVVLVCALGLLYAALLGAKQVYVSRDSTSSAMNQLYEIQAGLFEELPAYNYERFGLSDPGPRRVERVTAYHASRNALFVVALSILLTFVPPLIAVMGIGSALRGVFTMDWEYMLIGPLALLLAVVVGMVVPLGMFVVWLTLLIQPCSLSYAILWVVGLPLMVPFMAMPAAPVPMFWGGAAEKLPALWVVFRVR